MKAAWKLTRKDLRIRIPEEIVEWIREVEVDEIPERNWTEIEDAPRVVEIASELSVGVRLKATRKLNVEQANSFIEP